MLDSKLHIDDLFHNKHLQVRVATLAFFTLILKPFKVHYWRTKLLTRLNRTLNKAYLISEGVKSLILNTSDDELKKNIQEKYKEALDALDHARELYLRLEKSNFFNSKMTEELAERMMSNFYAIEAKLKQFAFDNVSNPEDETLFEFASQLSFGSLQA